MLHLWPRLHREPGLFLWSGSCVPFPGLRMGCTFRNSLKRKLCPGIRLQSGMPFPVERLAESSSQNMAPERDALSETALKRKLCPRIPSQNGMRFPLAACLESASQFERLFRDAVSAGRFNRKACPVLELDSGTRFPPGMPFGKCVPFWAFELGRAFRGCCRWESASQFGRQAGISSAASTTPHR